MSVVGTICVALLAVTGVLCIVRIVRGPTMLDRTVAADVFVAASAGAIGIEAAVERRQAVHEAAAATAGPAFLARVNGSCGHCPVRSSCPAHGARP